MPEPLDVEAMRARLEDERQRLTDERDAAWEREAEQQAALAATVEHLRMVREALVSVDNAIRILQRP